MPDLELPENRHAAHPKFGPIDFKTRFPALDGIRALAVLMVFACHYGGGAHGSLALRIFNFVRERGGYGVDLFFVLSGFLITGILYDTRADSQFFKRFFARRSVRIFPVAYLLFAILAILTPIFGYEWKWQQAWFLVYLGNFVANANFGLYNIPSPSHPLAQATIGHLWSLCVEEQFYLLWPVVVWLVRDRLRLLWIGVSVSVLTLLLRVAMVLYLDPSTAERWIMRTLPFRMDDLLFGAVLALLLRGPLADQVQRSMKWLFLGCLVPVVLMFLFVPGYTSPWLLTVGLTLIGLTCTGLIGMTLRTGSPAFRLFSFGPARILGKYSYGFYVWHLVWSAAWLGLLEFLERSTHSLVIAGLICLPLNLVTTFLVAKLSYDFFEVRFLRLKRHFEYDSEQRTHKTAFAPDGN
jgi:peptidoglycan/LPS O-acetylase OafA/YrhL